MADYEHQSDRRALAPQYEIAAAYQRASDFQQPYNNAQQQGRSQTMTMSSQQPGYNSTPSFSNYPRPIPPQAGQMRPRAPLVRPSREEYGIPLPRAPREEYNVPLPPQQQSPQHPQQQAPMNGYGSQPPRPQMNGYPSANPMSQGGYPPSQAQLDRRPYPQQPRPDMRSASYGQYGRPPPGRGPPMVAAMNADPNRTRSMASLPHPGYGGPPPMANYGPGAANALRQPAYFQGPQHTSSGRIIPDRPPDSRTMSMTAYPDPGRTQTMNGRIIPNRRPESYQTRMNGDQYPLREEQSVTSPPANINGDASHDHVRPTNGLDRSASQASTVVSPGARTDSLEYRPSIRSTTTGSSATTSQTMVEAQAISKLTLINSAFLSQVAQIFIRKIDPQERYKDDLSYTDSFTGKDAVDLLSHIIRTPDRNLALLLGRALDAQKFFHDVTYEHRLRDSPVELYQFKEQLGEDPTTSVNGVFTLLSECYSPTCTRDKLCYSIACPRRLEQQQRLNLKLQPGLRRQGSSTSLHADDKDEQKLWVNTVPKDVAENIDDNEKKRQEIIFELMYTERDFVKDLEYLRDFWMKPLRSSNPQHPSVIPESRREKFVQKVFYNIMDVHAVNARLAEALTRRQQESHVVHSVGDIFLQNIPRFEPFILYGANQLFGKYEFENERSINAAFQRFVDETERLKESRKLELNGYLTKPTTRLARYPLLLEQILKKTKDDNPDKRDLPIAIEKIRERLSELNTKTGESENRFNLIQLSRSLKFEDKPYVNLRLEEEGRSIIFKGPLKKSPTDTSEIMVWLFDHAVLMAKQKIVRRREEVHVYRRPIPLELLSVAQLDVKLGLNRPASRLAIAAAAPTLNRDGHPITFRHLGKPQYEITLFANNALQRQKWLEAISEQQRRLRDRPDLYRQTDLCRDFFAMDNKVNCLVPTDGGRKLIYGTNHGVYISDRKPQAEGASTVSKPRKLLDLTNVTQVEVMEEYMLLLVLSNKALLSFALDQLLVGDTSTIAQRSEKRGKKIQSNATFFKSGVCTGRHLVCTAKSSAMNTTIKVFEPTENTRQRQGGGLRSLIGGNADSVRPYKEFYIGAESSSLHFLRNNLCVACVKGFEIVSLETLERQSLLDQADTSLDFVSTQKGETSRPVHIERLNGEFLLNYSDFSFFVNRNGWRARPEWKITWEGSPQSFALIYPYILAFEPSFIEIRDVETSMYVHILTSRNIRMLHAATREIIYAYEDDEGRDIVASLDFWQASGR